jgi:CheY-like chemotaxis protein
MRVAPRTVLLVDDDAAIREALSDLLTDEGVTVHAVANGREAVDWLHSASVSPDVVLLDLSMPVMDGRTFLSVRKTDPVLSRVPVVVITAERAVADLAAKYRLDGILPKPIVVESLLEMLDRGSQDQPGSAAS